MVDQDAIDEFANEHNLRFVRASAQDNMNVEQVIIMMVQNLLDKVFPSLHNPEATQEQHKTIRLNLADKPEGEDEQRKELEDTSASICCPT